MGGYFCRRQCLETKQGLMQHRIILLIPTINTSSPTRDNEPPLDGQNILQQLHDNGKPALP